MYCVTAGCPLTRLTLVGSRRPPQPIAPARVKPSREPSLSHLPRSSGLCIVGGLHRRPTRPAPASTSVTRDLLHPRSSSALSDRDHMRARARAAAALLARPPPFSKRSVRMCICMASPGAWQEAAPMGSGSPQCLWLHAPLAGLASCLSLCGVGCEGQEEQQARRASDGHPPRCVA